MKKSPNQPTMKSVRIIVEGRVQGVGFRFFTTNEARRLGLNGWVRNLYDGRVETVAEGPEDRLQQFVTSIQAGPSMSYVSNCQVTWSEATGQYSGFHVAF